MTRPGTPSYVGSCRECGVVNGHSGSCRVDLIVEGITRGLRREGYILIEASHHADIVAENARLRTALRQIHDLADGLLNDIEEAQS
jgi:hypothetical protein